MHRPPSHTRVVLVVLASLIVSPPMAAQDTGYIAGAGFADIRLFGGTESRSPLFNEDASRDATGAGGSIRVGTWVHPRWTLEVGADVSSKTSTTYVAR